MSDCDASRGKTECVGFGCVCQAGYCASDNGTCVRDPRIPRGCDIQTNGTCWLEDCDKSRGPTDCFRSQCLCKEGFCVVNGVCREDPKWTCNLNTGGTCEYLGCDASRGPSDCKFGICMCKEGFCSDSNGKCQAAKTWTCNRESGGTCKYLSCDASRGPTDCTSGSCMCKEGFCSDVSGRCQPRNATVRALAGLRLPRAGPSVGWHAPVVLALLGGIVTLIQLLSSVATRYGGGTAAVTEPLLDNSH